jgi:drug/metabolite transporter superfamily protein YnfA
MHISGFFICLLGLAYFTLAIVFPKIRPFQKGRDQRIGTVVCIGGVIVFLAPALTFLAVVNNLLDVEYKWIGYLFALSGVLVIGIGSLIDRSE